MVQERNKEKKYFVEFSEKEYTYQNLWTTMKTVLRWKFIALRFTIKN